MHSFLMGIAIMLDELFKEGQVSEFCIKGIELLDAVAIIKSNALNNNIIL